MFLFACSPDDEEDEKRRPEGDADTDADGDTDADTDADGDTDTGVSPDAPYIVSVDNIDCGANTDGQDAWIMQMTADDPQGTQDIAPIGTMSISFDGNFVSDESVVCLSDGQCSASWESNDNDLLCDAESALTFVIIIYDDEGHASAPYEYP
jgi:hypothetical protein